MISPASIKDVMSRADIVDVVGQFVRLKKRGASYIANCPFHNEKTPSFHVSPAKGIYKCFGCGKAGDVVSFIQDHEKLTYPDTIRWLADFYKITLDETERTPEQQQQQLVEEGLRILNEYATLHFHDALLNTEEGQTIGMSYFKQRGFRKEIIERFRLGYDGEHGDDFYKAATQKGYAKEILERSGLIKNYNGIYRDVYRGRVIFPIQSITGRILGFGARILKNNDKAPKYINTPENELYIKSRVLYGLYQSRQAIGKLDECILVEGYTDVISLHQGGVENVVASSGTSLTEDQLRLIGQLTKNLTILYDGDAAGVKAALRGLDMALSQSFNVQLVLLPESEDPDSFIQKSGASVFHEYVKKHKQDIISFKLEVGMQEAGDDPVKKSKLINEIAESISHIDKTKDFVLQGHYIHKVSRLLNVDEQGLVNLVNKYIRDGIEKEHKQLRKEEVLPAPETQSANQQEPEAGRKFTDEGQEWQLLRVLIEFGHRPYKDGETVSMYIENKISSDIFDQPIVRKLYDEYFEHCKHFGMTPELHFFINYPDVSIRQRMATLLHTREEISPGWKEKYGVETQVNYISDVESTLAYFELKKIILIQDNLARRLGQEKDPIKQKALIEAIIEESAKIKNDESGIIKQHGTVVLSSLKNQ